LEILAKVVLSLSSLKVEAAILELEEREGEGEPRISHDQRS
jgi:hypothetical protein